MTSSDNDFDDEDDEFLLNLATQALPGLNLADNNGQNATTTTTFSLLVPLILQLQFPSSSLDLTMQEKLYRADGEISILREKYQHLQSQRQQEINKAREQQQKLQFRSEDQIKALQYTVQKLEDEKRFLTNELKGGGTKRRKKINGGTGNFGPSDLDADDDMDIDGQYPYSPGVQTLRSFTPTKEPSKQQAEVVKKSSGKIIRIQDDSTLFIDSLWSYCIIGANRTSLHILSKIYLERDTSINELYIKRKQPISTCLVEYLMLKKNLRLDDLVKEFTLTVVSLIEELLSASPRQILSIPFLLSLVHASINFRPLAVTKPTVVALIKRVSCIAINFWNILEQAQSIEEEGNYQNDSPVQIIILQNLILIYSIDIIEKLTSISTLHGDVFIKEIWNDEILPKELLKKCLPDNTERFKNTSQINLINNIIEILMSSITETSFSYYDLQNERKQQSLIFNSLLKVLLIETPLKENFLFYGLNRVIGNNSEMSKVESVVPIDDTPIGTNLVSIPCPIMAETLDDDQRKLKSFEVSIKHQTHLLNIRIRVTTLLEHYILITSSIETLQLKDFIKSMVRTIGFEQYNILKNPRSKNINLRTQIIGNLVRILNYISSDSKGGISNLVYPETLYEIFVVLLRIAFGTSSLSQDARKILEEIRNNPRYFKNPIFNYWCEIRSKQLNHIDNTDGHNGKFISDIESQYANGVEFPYEEETIELSREILDLCVTHEEADNLYFNMNCQDVKNNLYEESNFDEMDLVE